MSPAGALVERLAQARRDGLRFEGAWPFALADALGAVADERERRAWAKVLDGMVSTWRAAFERRPSTPSEDALLRAVAEREVGEPLPDRPCEHCGQAIDPDRGRRALYCSELCRRAAGHLRTAPAAA